MAVITISRQNGSLGEELASYLASKLGCGLVTRDYAIESFFANESEEVKNGLRESSKYFLKSVGDNEYTYKDVLSESLNELADDSNNLIVLGLGGSIILGGRQDTVNVRVIASEQSRQQRISRQYRITNEEAKSILSIADRKHKRFVSYLFGKDLDDFTLYDLVFNTDNLTVDECAQAIVALIEKRVQRINVTNETLDNQSIDHQTAIPNFKNDTESEFARILDMYNIEWLYEPKTFPIEWDSEGNITMAFSPDFYLPRFNLYLELTTMDQKYVTKKNKKARKVMELYPGTNIRIVYKKDFAELVKRFNQLGG